jgi:hypothetical protein
MLAKLPLRLLGLLLLTLAMIIPGCQALFRPAGVAAPFHPGFEQHPQQQPGRQGRAATLATALPSV